MNKYEITSRIERIAPPETAESWDCSGWLVETNICNIKKILFALTVTDDIVNQAKGLNCDMIISHHPLFFVPVEYKNIDIYCAHTNLDIADGGTTDCLIRKLCNLGLKCSEIIKPEGFVRYIETEVKKEELFKILSQISTNFRYTGKETKVFHKLGICAGSGSEFIKEAFKNGADGFITGDLKFHTALESPITVFDIGHFESEIPVLNQLKNIINFDGEIYIAKENSPISVYTS